MSHDEKRLLKLFRALSEEGRRSLLDYADFLLARMPGERATPSDTPLSIARPPEESVIKAIKRLMSTYPMLDRDKLLTETSAQMTRHLMHKHPAKEVIDELEAIFRRHYAHYRAEKDSPSS